MSMKRKAYSPSLRLKAAFRAVRGNMKPKNWEIEERLQNYFDFYYRRRPHQALAYQKPAQVYAS